MEKNPTYKELQEQLAEAKEQLKQAEQLKNSFLSNMSHEIRTPMNAVVGASELLRDDSLSKDERNEFTKILNSSSKELLDLFNRILELSQLESGVVILKESEKEIHTLFEKLHISFSKKIYDSKKNIILNYYQDLEEIKILTDHDKLFKILSYLLDNAVKFTDKGEIDFGCAIQDKNNILFYVKDTGPGIAEKESEKIFKKFTQIDNSYTRVHSGAGLGLSLCKGLINTLKGKIHIDSKIGDGSIFYFTIPFKISESNLVLKEKIEAIIKKNNTETYSLSKALNNIAI
nr:HAMP domain-containing sensor histidine kinase [uncultured Marinifilum sp.]